MEAHTFYSIICFKIFDRLFGKEDNGKVILFLFWIRVKVEISDEM